MDPGESRLLRQEGGELDGSVERVHLGLRQPDRLGGPGPDLEDLEPGGALEGIGGRRRGLLCGGRAEERSRGEEQEEGAQGTGGILGAVRGDRRSKPYVP